MLLNPVEETSDALRFGSLFHQCMAALAQGDTLQHIIDAIPAFEPPVNPRTGRPYGNTARPYTAAYARFRASLGGIPPSTPDEKATLRGMLHSLLCDSGATSAQVRKLLRWGKPEVSHFIEYEGCRFKWRPDLETPRKIIDWKSVATDDMSEESINRIILRYSYHISAAFYQFFTHQQTGKWKQFILVLVSKVPPYDCVMVDMSNYCYRYIPEADMVAIGPGAMEFQKLLALHVNCTRENHWPGAESAIPDRGGVRILEIQPPGYYTAKFIEEI